VAMSDGPNYEIAQSIPRREYIRQIYGISSYITLQRPRTEKYAATG